MTVSRRQFLQRSGLAAAYLALPAVLGGCGRATSGTRALDPLAWAGAAQADAAQADPALLHLLGRLTYGPAPGDLARITALGADAFIDEQLHPERLDDSVAEAALQGFETLQLSSAALLERYAPRSDPGPQEIVRQLQQASLLRAVLSTRQLHEIMVDLWSNHFNIAITKGQCRWLKTADDREVIRPHALGTFSDLLLASAKSPAMLFYLDNVDNVAAGSKGSAGGLNENYARELLELHTLGADAPYDHADIVAVARTFTGWGIANRQQEQAGSFAFRLRLHDNGAKQVRVLALDLPAGSGLGAGEALLTRLARDPHTAQRIARKLCLRFVSDDPPTALVERAAQTYLASDTDIRATLGVILRSDEFKTAPPKIKLPTHAFVSMLRALGASVEPSPRLNALLTELGQPFFAWPAPDGYPQTGLAWASTSGLLARWNAAFALAEGRLPGVTDNLAALVASHDGTAPDALVDALCDALLHAPLGSEARAALVGYARAAAPAQRVPGLVGLMLASPLFQLY